MSKLKYITGKTFPPFLSEIIQIDPKDLPIDATARIFCQRCGLYNRAILCPPLLAQTHPQFKTIDSSRKYFNSFKEAYIYIFKNDGRQRWWMKKEHQNFSHLTLKRRVARQLKGTEVSSARWITRRMRKVRQANEKAGFVVDAFIQGHCDLCSRKCPNRENPPCIRGGLASLEACGINVYQLLRDLGIDYEYPVVNYLTQVTMMVVA